METRRYVEVSAQVSDAPARSAPLLVLFHRLFASSIERFSKILSSFLGGA